MFVVFSSRVVCVSGNCIFNHQFMHFKINFKVLGKAEIQNPSDFNKATKEEII